MPVEQKILAKLKLNLPATEAEVRELAARFGTAIPPDYLEFLRSCDGAEGFLERCYAQIWPAERVLKSKEDYRVEEFAPGLLLFGSDGGGEAWGFDCHATPWQIVQIPFIPMDWKESKVIAKSFSDFFAFLDSK